VTVPEPGSRPAGPGAVVSGSVMETFNRSEAARPVLLPLVGLFIGVLAGWLLNVNVSFEFSRYSAVAILAALDSVLGAVRAELDGVYDNRIFISGFLTNAIVAVLLTFIGDRLSLDLYLVALINFGFRIFNNVALIRRHFI
jgi:small basic protein